MRLALNEVQLSDDPWSNPFDESAQRVHTYLGYDSYEQQAPESGVLGFYTFLLGQTKVIKSRTVYNWITLLSEVSGFADILLVFPSFLIGLFYTQKLKDHALANMLGFVSFPN